MSIAITMALLLSASQAAATPPPAAPPERRVERHVVIINDDGPGGPGGPRGPRDADNDGFVSREEFVAPMSRMFDRLDTNHDGRLSPAELADGPPPPPPGGPHHGPHGAHGPHGGPGGPGEDVRIEIRRVGGPGGDLDANGDGKVTEDEFIAPLRDAFRRLDADSSGDLTEGERGTGHGGEDIVIETTED